MAVVLDADVADAELFIHMANFSIGGNHVGEIAQGKGIFEGELLAGDLLGGGPDADHGHVEDPENVRAHGGDPIGHAVVEAVDHRRDGDDGSDADDNAEDGETGAQFVLAQGVKRHPYRFAILPLGHGTPSRQLVVVSSGG